MWPFSFVPIVISRFPSLKLKSGVYEVQRKLKELTAILFIGCQGPYQVSLFLYTFQILLFVLYIMSRVVVLSENSVIYIHSTFLEAEVQKILLRDSKLVI